MLHHSIDMSQPNVPHPSDGESSACLCVCVCVRVCVCLSFSSVCVSVCACMCARVFRRIFQVNERLFWCFSRTGCHAGCEYTATGGTSIECNRKWLINELPILEAALCFNVHVWCACVRARVWMGECECDIYFPGTAHDIIFKSSNSKEKHIHKGRQ